MLKCISNIVFFSEPKGVGQNPNLLRFAPRTPPIAQFTFCTILKGQSSIKGPKPKMMMMMIMMMSMMTMMMLMMMIQ